MNDTDLEPLPELPPVGDSEPEQDPMTKEEAATYVLKQAARKLRDAELAKRDALREYQQALDAFNRAVAPAPGQ